MDLKGITVQQRIKSGNIGEFEILFLRYYEPLCHYSFRFTKDMTASEDIVQEFFYNFWKNRESLNLKFSLHSYLFQSVMNNSLHYLKSRAVRDEYCQEVRKRVEGEQSVESEGGMIENELNEIILKTLQQMPERTARIFRMNRFEGKKYREIAEALSISVKTVEADMTRALQLFRESLSDYYQPVPGAKLQIQ
jgi:RNA polymerase sigma-70 factor (ECF subfamily)